MQGAKEPNKMQACRIATVNTKDVKKFTTETYNSQKFCDNEKACSYFYSNMITKGCCFAVIGVEREKNILGFWDQSLLKRHAFPFPYVDCAAVRYSSAVNRMTNIPPLRESKLFFVSVPHQKINWASPQSSSILCPTIMEKYKP